MIHGTNIFHITVNKGPLWVPNLCKNDSAGQWLTVERLFSPCILQGNIKIKYQVITCDKGEVCHLSATLQTSPEIIKPAIRTNLIARIHGTHIFHITVIKGPLWAPNLCKNDSAGQWLTVEPLFSLCILQGNIKIKYQVITCDNGEVCHLSATLQTSPEIIKPAIRTNLIARIHGTNIFHITVK
jgi:hypothetical protein